MPLFPNELFEKFTERAKAALNTTLSNNLGAPAQPLDLFVSILRQKGSLGTNVLNAHNINLQLLPKTYKLKIPSLAPKNKHSPKKNLLDVSANLKIVLKKAAALASNYQSRFIGTEHLVAALIKQPEIKKILQTNLPKEIITRLEDQLEMILASAATFPNLNSLINKIDHPFSEKREWLSPAPTPEEESENFNSLKAVNSPRQVLPHRQKFKEPARALEYFTVDLVAKASSNKLDPVIGREKETERLISILSRRTKNNPVLVGEPGVGKTAIVWGLAQKIARGQAPEHLSQRKILSLDLGLLIAGTVFRGEFEGRLKDVLKEADEDKAILFIDELHTIIGAGSTQGSLDAANLLKPAISSGQLQVIGATTSEEYRKHIERDPAFERRFQPLLINEPDENETLRILRGLKKHFEDYHSLTIADDALEQAVWYAKRFITNRYLPDKAIDVLDEAAAELRLAQKPAEEQSQLRLTQEDLKSITGKKEQAILEEKYEQALQWKIEEEKLKQHLKALTFETKEKTQKNKNTKVVVGLAEIQKAISQITGIPLSQISEPEKNKLISLEKRLKSKIVGQDQAVGAVAAALKRNRVGLKDENRPLGSFIFLGPSGVGKTELAKVLAETYFENPKALVKLDMSEFAEGHTISRLLGAPAGYIGYEDSGKFLETIRRQPYALVLFDEIEKAHPQIHNLMLQILEDGELTTASGTKVSFKNTLIIFTSNVGNDHFWKNTPLGFQQDTNRRKVSDQKKSALKDLGSLLRPELLSRVDEIIVFQPLNKTHLRRIIELELKKLSERLKKQNLPLIKYTPSAVEWLTAQSISLKHGARKIRQTVRKYVEDSLAQKIISDELKGQRKITLDWSKNKLVWKLAA